MANFKKSLAATVVGGAILMGGVGAGVAGATTTPSAVTLKAVDDNPQVNLGYSEYENINVLGNDVVDANDPVVSLKFIDSSGNKVTDLSTADAWYLVNDDNTVYMNPDSSFKGKVTEPVKYEITTKSGATSIATLTPTVSKLTKVHFNSVVVKADVNFNTPMNKATTFNILTNMKKLEKGTITNVALLDRDDNRVSETTTPDGSYVLKSGTSGNVTFTPKKNYSTKTLKQPLRFLVTYSDGHSYISTIKGSIIKTTVAKTVPVKK